MLSNSVTCHLGWLFLGTTPHPVTVTTRIITFLVGNPYKPSFVTVTGWGVDLSYSLSLMTLQFRWMVNSPSPKNFAHTRLPGFHELSSWVFPTKNRGGEILPPNHPIFNRAVFHDFHHPFWGKIPLFLG